MSAEITHYQIICYTPDWVYSLGQRYTTVEEAKQVCEENPLAGRVMVICEQDNKLSRKSWSGTWYEKYSQDDIEAIAVEAIHT